MRSMHRRNRRLRPKFLLPRPKRCPNGMPLEPRLVGNIGDGALIRYVNDNALRFNSPERLHHIERDAMVAGRGAKRIAAGIAFEGRPLICFKLHIRIRPLIEIGSVFRKRLAHVSGLNMLRERR